VAHTLELNTITDPRGSLTVIENVLPFEIKRVYTIYGMPYDAIRGGHRHKKTIQAITCIKGSCVIFNHNGKNKEEFHLNHPNSILVLNPEDWHQMYSFSDDCILMILSSDHYDPHDYIMEKYPEVDI
jgi:dTDP-4-dehydrorhamnose 3,5-epimerase-like enzyme